MSSCSILAGMENLHFPKSLVIRVPSMTKYDKMGQTDNSWRLWSGTELCGKKGSDGGFHCAGLNHGGGMVSASCFFWSLSDLTTSWSWQSWGGSGVVAAFWFCSLLIVAEVASSLVSLLLEVQPGVCLAFSSCLLLTCNRIQWRS